MKVLQTKPPQPALSSSISKLTKPKAEPAPILSPLRAINKNLREKLVMQEKANIPPSKPAFLATRSLG